jgi:hypothetical protein
LKVRPLAICTADFPDDAIETEDGKGFLDHGGRSVAEAIAEILSRLGCTVAAPKNAAEYGWRFDWAFKGQAFWCQVSSIPPEFYLHFEGALLRKDVSPKNHLHGEIFMALNAELARDGRFHGVLWYPSVGGTVRLEDEAAAMTPLAPESPTPRRTRKSRPALFLAGWIGLLATLMSVEFRASAIGFVTLLVSAYLVLVGSGLIKAHWLRVPSKRAAAAADENSPPK